MQNISITASELKRKASDILNTVYFGGAEVTVERHGKPVAKITAIKKRVSKKKDIKKLLDKYFGIMPDFPDVRKARKFRKRYLVF